MKNYNTSILFILLLLAISFYYNYHEIIFKRPQSVHKWRQSDCASIALNYYQEGMNFFNPQTHNLTSEGGTSGRCSTSEIPILYYTVAGLYSVFGYHESIFRIFNTLLFFLGLFYLFKLFFYLLKDSFWAISLSILFFTSPVLIYYGNNFLSNSAALAISIVAWYYFVRFLFEKKSKWFYISMLAYLIAGALKVTALLSFFPIAGIALLESFGLIKLESNRKVFNQPIKFILIVLSVFLIIGLWIIYARLYNQKYDCTYFSTTIFPIWNLDREGIITVLNRVQNIWLKHYFHYSVLLFFSICIVFLGVKFKTNLKAFNLILIFMLIEAIAYIILQFWTFADHDYYTIELYILPVIFVSGSFYVLKMNHRKIFYSTLFRIVFAGVVLFNTWYAQNKNFERYTGWMNDYKEKKNIYNITPFLRQHGISFRDTVISIPDLSHASLYLMNQKGWTEYTDARFNRGQKIRYNQSKAGIERSIKNGAKYLIVQGIEELYKKSYLREFCTYLVGRYNTVLVFNLKTNIRNFNLNERKVKQRFFCGAEHRSMDGSVFMNLNDSVQFFGGDTQNNKFVRTGNFSSKLNADSPYGMTIKIKDLKSGESFKISVWRKTKGKANGGIIASDPTSDFYNNHYDVIEKDPTGWEKLQMEFFISEELNKKEIGIYLYNPNSEANYFDDFEIFRYGSIYENN